MPIITVKLPDGYNFVSGLWKAARGALLATLALLLASGGVDTFFNSLSTGIGTLGLPVWAIPVVSAIIVFLRNYIKQYIASKASEAPKEVPPAQ